MTDAEHTHDPYPTVQGMKFRSGYNPAQHGGTSPHEPVDPTPDSDAIYPSPHGATDTIHHGFNPTQHGSSHTDGHGHQNHR